MEVLERAAPSAIGPDAPAGRRWDIAVTLGLSAKNYLSGAFQKLHVERRSQAAALFSRGSGDR